MRDTFPTWYASPLNQQAVTELMVVEWLLEHLKDNEVLKWDWTARIYEGQSVCKHEVEYGLPPPDRIGVSYIRTLRELLDQFGLLS